MKTRKENRLAASFVVTVAALPALSALGGCRKQLVDNTPGGSERAAYVSRNGERCTMSPPEHCPKGASCNPPPPTEIDCPPNLRDAGELVPKSSARPAGKEDWLRTKPRLWASQYGCGYEADRFCAPPPKAFTCTSSSPTVTIDCKAVPGADGGKSGIWALESFLYRDGLGACHRVPAFECAAADCGHTLPPDEAVACP